MHLEPSRKQDEEEKTTPWTMSPLTTTTQLPIVTHKPVVIKDEYVAPAEYDPDVVFIEGRRVKVPTHSR